MSHPAPVDLSNLREMTDGDRDFEQQMFEAFFESSQECIQNLTQGLAAGDNSQWRDSAHALKGVAYNLGAKPLGDLCKIAQKGCDAPQHIKTDQLKAIHSAYDEVQKYLIAI